MSEVVCAVSTAASARNDSTVLFAYQIPTQLTPNRPILAV